MRTWMKRLGVLLGLVVLAALGLLAVSWWKTDQALAQTYTVNDPPLAIARDAETLAQGAHVFTTRGCGECHGADGAGKLVVDAGPVMQLVAPNITSGGRTHGLSGDAIAAAIRHGVKPDGHPMMFMPSADYHDLSDADTAALVAYVQSLPASEKNPGPASVGPLGRVLYALGKLPLIPAESLDHSPRARSAPPPAATAEYGRYLAQSCTGCHGENFAGQHVPGTPPEFPDAQNLTPANIGAWTVEDFRHALRTGQRPDGSAINEFMPWRSFGKLSDTEVDALWAYLKTVPPVQNPKK